MKQVNTEDKELRKKVWQFQQMQMVCHKRAERIEELKQDVDAVISSQVATLEALESLERELD